MNIKQVLRKLASYWPHALVLLGFAIMSLAYFSPVLKGKVLSQSDNIQATGAARELVNYEQQTGERAQWTDSMFGGMPAYQIKADSSSNIFNKLSHWIRFGLPYTTAGILFLYLVGFYILLLTLKMNRWLAVAGAVAFALGSYNIIIIAAGHITKSYAIAMMPLVVAGVLMVFSGRRIVGGVFTVVALGLELAYNHIQITYYLALALVILAIIELFFAIRERTLPTYAKNIGVLAAAVVLSVLPSLTNLWTTYEYGLYSIRGASELSSAEGEKSGSGLDKDYALAWSYGVSETPTLIVPNVVGGASEPIGQDNKALRSMSPQIAQAVSQSSAYWGGRSFTSGPVYVGAIVCFLFFIGCFFYTGRLKWWLIVATVFSIFLAWGKNFPLLTDFMFDYFPLYNKFRTVEMALVIATVTIPLLGMLGLKAIYDNPEDIKYHPGKFFGALGLSAGFALVLFAFPTLFYDFLSSQEGEQLAELTRQNALYAQLQQGLVDARVQLLREDAFRSVVFIVLASSALWFCSVGRLNTKIMTAAIAMLTVIDLWSVDRRYLSDEDFKDKRETQTFALTNADKAILADKEPHRVVALYANPFNEVRTSYYHHSVGGYHGAKLRRYQDVVDYYMAREWQAVSAAVRSQDYEGIEKALASATTLNMLNTKYLIYNPQQQPIVNPYAFPRAWFVSDVVNVSSADEAIDALGKTNLRQTAVIEDAQASSSADSTATVRQVAYAPDKVSYETSSAKDGLAVFSEIYYPAGWQATIDGKEAEILHADYVLRALQVPAGNHKIEFSFKPTSYRVGRVVSMVASALIVVLVLGVMFFSLIKSSKEEK